MGLDIRFAQRHKIVCPHCGKEVGYRDLEEVGSGGRAWYEFLKTIGYYVPKAEHDEWYGKDMVLTEDQARELYEFVSEHEAYNGDEVKRVIAVALFEKDDIVVNADW